MRSSALFLSAVQTTAEERVSQRDSRSSATKFEPMGLLHRLPQTSNCKFFQSYLAIYEAHSSSTKSSRRRSLQIDWHLPATSDKGSSFLGFIRRRSVSDLITGSDNNNIIIIIISPSQIALHHYDVFQQVSFASTSSCVLVRVNNNRGLFSHPFHPTASDTELHATTCCHQYRQ
jgi:hypothetical protein